LRNFRGLRIIILIMMPMHAASEMLVQESGSMERNAVMRVACLLTLISLHILFTQRYRSSLLSHPEAVSTLHHAFPQSVMPVCPG
jgi:hypothetical protein